MIQKFNGYDEIQVSEGPSVEPGGYELMILGAKVESFTNCSILKIMFDIINNDKYAKVFSSRYQSAKAADPAAKWPSGGVFDVFIPKDDGSEMDGYTKQAFKRFITSVERSNSGYIWNWDENSLKGKVFGGVFGREQFETTKGQLKFAVKCRFPRSVDSIRRGDFTIPEDKLLKEKANAPALPEEPYLADVSGMGTAYQNGFEEIPLPDGPVPF